MLVAYTCVFWCLSLSLSLSIRCVCVCVSSMWSWLVCVSHLLMLAPLAFACESLWVGPLAWLLLEMWRSNRTHQWRRSSSSSLSCCSNSLYAPNLSTTNRIRSRRSKHGHVLQNGRPLQHHHQHPPGRLAGSKQHKNTHKHTLKRGLLA